MLFCLRGHWARVWRLVVGIMDIEEIGVDVCLAVSDCYYLILRVSESSACIVYGRMFFRSNSFLLNY